MGGRIPIKDQPADRVRLVDEVLRRKIITKDLAKRLVEALNRCPSMSCSYCEHMPRAAAHE